MPRENRLQGKAAIITGAASGMGEASVRLFTEQGCKVLAVDINGEQLEEKHGGNPDVVCLAIDITLADAPERIVGTAVESFGRLDILFNNAGIQAFEPYLQQQPGMWERIFEVNVTSMNRLTLAAVPHLKESGNGRVINTGSVVSDLAAPGLTSYAVSKSAIAGLTRQQSLDLGPLGITANFIQPGFIVTGMTEEYVETAPPGDIDYWRNKTTVGRLGEAIDIANAALFFAQDSSNFISGIGLHVDGGASIKM